jgi:beta-lactamase regulating signal transducer with metallopeptidase domain
LAELALVFQWFNSFAWLYRKQVENNLEFLTDDSMINRRGIERTQYQLSLLKVSVPHLPSLKEIMNSS